MRTGKELLVASKEFANERRWQSWWILWSTIAVLAILIAIAVSNAPLAVRIVASILAGLTNVRMFIIYHDFQHNAILRNSRIATLIMQGYGILTLSPSSVWTRSHNHHHKNNSRSFGASIGSYPIMTNEAFRSASRKERWAYIASRHPLMILSGYFTMFFWQMCLRPFFIRPLRHWDGGLAAVIQIAALIGLCFLGFDVMVLGLLLPLVAACCLGAYLFYAQHNFPAAVLMPSGEWTHVGAALQSSSYMRMWPVMRWFTGNIGFHHVHHLNARIPFYRLPEAMAALEELQSPGTTSLHPRDVIACFRLKVWSPEQNRLVGFNGET